MGAAPWAILDFPGLDGNPVREVYRDPVEVVEARSAADVRRALDRAEALNRSGLVVVGFVAYDAAPGLEPKFEIRPGYQGPLVWLAAFDDKGSDQSTKSQGEPDKLADPRIEVWSPDFVPDDYRGKVARIIEGICRGDYYQVNLTERFTSRIDSPRAVYERLRAAQDARYSAYIETAEMAVLSVSPELFLHRSGSMIESRPMKGTAARGRWTEEDDAAAVRLSTTEKERAENVMIVDLIRNDMGRIAVPGTVEVPSMFTVEKYPTVLQMTSHVMSQLKDGTSLADIFAAVFPCGSVTGAPKIAASASIATLESGPRGVYCGAVGVLRPGGEEFTFNVAIRTAVVDRRTADSVYGAGGGITADSDPGRELAELKAKAAVLTSIPRKVELLETLRLEDGRVPRLDLHLGRLAGSAAYFGFAAVDQIVENVRRSIETAAADHPSGLHRVRVVVTADGSHRATIHPHSPDLSPQTLAMASTPVRSDDRHLYHKLTDRRPYLDRLAEVRGAADAVMMNERGELTETTIGNLVLEIDGRRLTPRLDCGLLPGVFRGVLLDAGAVEEAVLYPADLIRATRVWIVNSLREWVPCRLV